MKHIKHDFRSKAWVDFGGGAEAKIQLFSEYDHVAYIYQIKWNHECSSMVANILPADPTPTFGKGSKFNFLRIWSCCISN